MNNSHKLITEGGGWTSTRESHAPFSFKLTRKKVFQKASVLVMTSRRRPHFNTLSVQTETLYESALIYFYFCNTVSVQHLLSSCIRTVSGRYQITIKTCEMKSTRVLYRVSQLSLAKLFNEKKKSLRRHSSRYDFNTYDDLWWPIRCSAVRPMMIKHRKSYIYVWHGEFLIFFLFVEQVG